MAYVKIQYTLIDKFNTGVFDTEKTSVTFAGLGKNDNGEVVRELHVVGGNALVDDVNAIIGALDEEVQKGLTREYMARDSR